MTISRNLSFLAEGVSSTGVLGATYGGTGQSSITTGDLLYGSASNTISKLAIGSTGTILRVVGGVPTWGNDYTGTVTSVAASVPAFLSISGSPITTSGTLAITYSGTALPIANGGTAQTSFTAGQVLYGSFNQSSNLFWDSTNNRLGLGTTSPSQVLTVGSSSFRGTASINGGTPFLIINDTTTGGHQYNIYGGASAVGNLDIYDSTAGAFRIILFGSGGVSIGNTTDPGAKNLSVSGTGKYGTTIGVGATTPASTGAGISFPATQSSSSDVNTLDDYEIGTWTPTQGAGLTVVGTFSSSGKYTKVGRIITLYGTMSATTSIVVGTSNIFCGGLPFATLDFSYGTIVTNATFTQAINQIAWRTSIYCVNAMSATTYLEFSFTYQY